GIVSSIALAMGSGGIILGPDRAVHQQLQRVPDVQLGLRRDLHLRAGVLPVLPVPALRHGPRVSD
ncbi:hypothetical protein, partial [Proteus mirabilis]|uniref:hypothetical protein n=1 Tax=Proteus mirabilis TaxID=584 RepID=UPI001953B7AF